MEVRGELPYYTQSRLTEFPWERQTLMTRAILLMALLTAAGCGGSSTSASSVPPTSVGVFTITDLVIGTGATAATGSNATVSYTGWLYDTGKPNGKGAQFDTGSFPFVVGTGVIAGFSQGVTGMKVGGQRRVIIPPDLAYGSQSPTATIPANATLVFEITLISIS
jgi:FKBP-type peptidyl-prolyl cis-trans isomerase